MKKKLEAELISIAHRILKLKNRGELDQLQQETLKLYEKISVLRFVEDNFADVKPTIGYASAEETLEEIYGIEEVAPVHANEVEAKEEKSKEEKSKVESQKSKEEPEARSQKPQEEEAEEESEQPATPNPEPETEEEPKVERQDESKVESPKSKEEEPKAEEEPANDKKVEVVKPEEEVKAMEASAEAVYKKEDNSTIEEEEKAADAEVITIEPDKDAKTEEVKLDFGFAFDRKPAPEETTKQKEITFEDYADYKEPEFVKKGDQSNAESQKPKDEPQAVEGSKVESQKSKDEPEPETPVRDWRDWEPSTSPYAEKKEELKVESQKSKEEPQAISQQPQVKEQPATRNPEPVTGTQPAAQNPTPNTQNLKTITLGLNDRIAFEKNLFGGSGEDLNRVISQLNTMDRFEDAKDFIRDLVKPDYNNWQGKEEYEERLMELVEKRFS